MILTLNILLSIIVVVGIVGLLAYNIHPLRRPLRLDDLTVARANPSARREPARAAHVYAARRGAESVARSLDGAQA